MYSEETQQNTEQRKDNIISHEEFEKSRQDGLEKLKDPAIRAVFMRLKDK